MVDLSGGQDGPIEHGFSNSVFILPGIVFISLSGVRDAAEDVAQRTPPHPEGGEFKMPSMEDLVAALEKMKDISDEEKQQIFDSLRGASDNKGGFVPSPIGAEVASRSFSIEIMFLLSLISFVFLILVFFGYKLYKSLVERERRKEEKRRQKQQKKKK